MKYITIKEFKSKPENVQEVFLKWWKPEIYDIYYWKIDGTNLWNTEIITNEEKLNVIYEYKNKNLALNTTIPLFTEGQLREFIEDKLKIKIECNLDFLKLDYDIKINNYDEKYIRTKTNDLFNAYWEVACFIAKEEVKNNNN